MKRFCRSNMLVGLALVLCLGWGVAHAAFPEKHITLIVHSSAGGGADLFARTFAAANDKEKFFPQPIIVENKPGGGGAVSFAYVAGKKGDPYFLLTTVASFLTTPLMSGTPVNYKNFTPIASFANDENVLIVNANSKYKSLKDIAADAKANPKKLTLAGSFVGSIESIIAYQIEKAAGVKLNYIAAGGGSDSVIQVLGGHIDMTVCNPGEALELQRANKIRIMGVFSTKRLVEAPNIPTFKEQGYDIEGAANNRGLCGPPGIPADARKILEAGLFKYSQSEPWKKYVKDNMLTEGWMDGVTYGKWLEDQNERYRAIYKEMGVVLKEKK